MKKRVAMISKELLIIFFFASSTRACPSSSKDTVFKGNTKPHRVRIVFKAT
jgi:hypothetical protein